MPTKKQLSQLWESEFEYRIGNNEGYNVRGSNMSGTGKDPFAEPFKGERIGIIQVDPVTKELKIIPDLDQAVTEESNKPSL